MKLRLKPTVVTVLCIVFAVNHIFLSALAQVSEPQVDRDSINREMVISPAVYSQPQGVAAEDYALWSGGYSRVNEINMLTGFIMFILLTYVILLTINRLAFYFRVRRQSLDFSSSPDLYEALLDKDLGEAMRVCAEYDRSHRARVVAAGLQAWQPARGAYAQSIERSRRAMQNAAVGQTLEFARGLWTLRALLWLAPLVGICGALLNMIDTLEGMWYAEGTGIFPFIRGMADALWCVSLGVGVAMLSAIACNAMRAMAERLEADMNDSSWMLFDYFLKWQIERTAIVSSNETLNLKETQTEICEPQPLWLYAR